MSDVFAKWRERPYRSSRLLCLNGEDLRSHPLIERKERLDALIPPERRIIRMAHFSARGKDQQVLSLCNTWTYSLQRKLISG